MLYFTAHLSAIFQKRLSPNAFEQEIASALTFGQYLASDAANAFQGPDPVASSVGRITPIFEHNSISDSNSRQDWNVVTSPSALLNPGTG
jgi:hypothetical protein